MKLYDYLKLEDSENGKALVSELSGYILPLEKIGRNPLEENKVNPAVALIEKLQEEKYTRDEIVRQLMEEYSL